MRNSPFKHFKVLTMIVVVILGDFGEANFASDYNEEENPLMSRSGIYETTEPNSWEDMVRFCVPTNNTQFGILNCLS